MFYPHVYHHDGLLWTLLSKLAMYWLCTIRSGNFCVVHSSIIESQAFQKKAAFHNMSHITSKWKIIHGAGVLKLVVYFLITVWINVTTLISDFMESITSYCIFSLMVFYKEFRKSNSPFAYPWIWSVKRLCQVWPLRFSNT